MKYLIIGDLHGCYAELVDLLKAVDYFNEPRQIISVGDIVDKNPGKDNYIKIIDFLMKEKAILVKGNHEEKFLRFQAHEIAKVTTGKANPMVPAKHPEKHTDFWDTWKQINRDSKYLDWIGRSPYYYYIPNTSYCAIHAGITPGKRPEDMDPKLICRVRNIKNGNRMAHLSEIDETMPFWFNLYYGTTKIVYGHIPFKEPMIKENSFGIDTGAVYGNKLSCLLLPEEEVVSVPARKQYAELYFPWPDQE